MSLYNMVFGNSGQAPLVFALLGLSRDDFGRYRDSWVEKNAAGEIRLAVYTRNGGGNREDYQHVFDTMESHPLYLSSPDDDFDCTYATFYFRAPEDAAERIAKLARENNVDLPEGWKLADVAQDAVDTSERWYAAIDAIKAATPPNSPADPKVPT